jgi:hypothetical protein
MNRISPAVDLKTSANRALDLVDDEAIGLAETGERTGSRVDITDLDDPALGIGRNHAQYRWRGEGTEAGLHQGAAGDSGKHGIARVGRTVSHGKTSLVDVMSSWAIGGLVFG